MQRELENLGLRITSVETNHSVQDVHRLNVERRLESIEDTLKWIVRLIMGAIILALLAVVLQGQGAI